MAIVRTDVPTTSELCQQALQQLARRYSFCRLEKLTTTAFGRPVWSLTMGEGDRHVIFSGAHHANEWITATVLLQFAEELARAIQDGGSIWGVPAETIRRYSTVHIVPMVNVLRADETGHCLSVDSILRTAPAREDAHISVPRTVEGNV